MNRTLPDRDLVLLGLGHTNAHVLRMWRMKPLPGVRLTCVSDFSIATYSGMLPGTLAGLYSPERMHIDLVRLCSAAGARLLRAEVTGLDLAHQLLLCADRPPIPFDVLSIGVGSVPKGAAAQAGELVLPIKPMQTFLARLDERLARLSQDAGERAVQIAIVGAGAGGVEITFCLPAHLERRWPALRYQLMLIDGGDQIMPGAAAGAVKLARRELAGRGVQLLLNQAVESVADGRLTLADGTARPVDLTIWATGAQPPPLLAALGLPADERGFLLVRPTLQTVADAPIFVVGDSGTCPERPRPKAGVYAVRQGPVLWENVRRMLAGQPLVEYRPQRGFLSLMATGDRRAILSYRGLAAHARWCWKLKDFIDRRFMDKYQDYRPMPAPMPAAAPAPTSAMRCAGCGTKVGGAVLSQVLARLVVPKSEHVLLGLESPDDAAIVRLPEGRPVVATVDFFPAILDDPYLVGRVAALNALSDVFALGARPLAAMAIASIPVGPSRQQEQLLYELLAGGLHELRRAGATLVGGHTIEAEQLTIGYSMLADSGAARPRLKSGLRPGDLLVLTKPLGAGILLAAHMRAQCKAAWMETLARSLLQSNQAAADVAHEFDLPAVTDVTGFGLAGHLLEMLRASDVAAELDLNNIPLLPGVAELLQEGVESTLAPANRAAETEIECGGHKSHAKTDAATCPDCATEAAVYAALFDPQTSGGLLLGVPPDQADEFVSRLRSHSELGGKVIGQVAPHDAGRRRIRLR
ncbi:MAG TPA: selenide, water dikinase SelD [Pirellulales bacterium]|nr:selenide, water dikinase SelD [Pirellulales bacterium]